MTRALRFAVYLISGAIAAWGLGVFVYDGMTKVPTFSQRFWCVHEYVQNESNYLLRQLDHPPHHGPDYYVRNLNDSDNLSPRELSLVHPILKVKAHTLPQPKDLRAIDFRRFRHFESPELFDTFYRCFDRCEYVAVEHFCSIVKGKTKQEVEKWLGKPDWCCDDVACWSKLKPGQNRQIYCFGIAEIPVKLIFDRGKCVDASICGDLEFSDYESWQLHRIVKTSIGQPLAVVLRKNGQPDRMTEADNPSKNLTRHQSNEEIYYSTSKTLGIVLTIQNGYCVQSAFEVLYRE
ncbi:MAG: hypothetical protein KA794_19330 [Candidatus Obscuribacter sp.]|nr:hypothetical protein [Candidatus Obscuribacter sp.]